MYQQQGYGTGESSGVKVSYAEYQEQLRQRQIQEQEAGRVALQRAGADSGSDKVRALINTMQELVHELSMAENQIQVQSEAQLRQLRKLKEKVGAAENEIRRHVSNGQLH